MAGCDWNPKLVAMRVEDAAGLGMTVGPGDGELSIGPRNSDNATRVRLLDRGRFDGYAVTEDLEQEMSITVRERAEIPTSAVAARLRDFLLRTPGSYFASAQSVSDCIWAFKVIFTFTNGGTTFTESWPYVIGEFSANHAFPSNTIALTLTANGAPTIA